MDIAVNKTMSELNSEDDAFFDELIEDENADDESVPNFAFPNLKGDPDLLCEFNTNDENTISTSEYLDQAIISNLSTLEFKWNSECLICTEQFEEYQELLEHCKQFHKNEFDEYTCTVGDCEELIADEDALARHLVLRHSDLHSIKIYGSCTFCNLRFSNFTELNKHSCYRKINRKACIQPYCQYCKEEFVSHKRFLFHLQFHLAKRRAKVCMICNTEFSDVEKFFLHVNYEHESLDKLACKICDRVFADLETYKAHENMHKSNPKYKCDECSKVYYNKKLLLKHKVNLHSAIEYECDLCPKIFPTFSILQNHLKWHNTEAEVHVYTCSNCGLLADCSTDCFECEIENEILTAAYSCHYCAQDFKDKYSLGKHRATGVHNNEKFICPICNEEIDSVKSKRLHMYKHKDYKNFQENLPLKRLLMCDVGDCEECYSDWAALQRHKTRIHKSNTCTKCNQKLADAAELQKHMKQCQAAALTCQFCDKVCPTKMSLAVHVARRHNNKNVVCPHCSAGYKDEQTLQQHIEYSHVPAPCTNCEKVLNCKRNLEIHMRVVHETETRYFCTQCNKGFYHRSQRDLHEESVHPDSIYKCGQCNFKTKYAKSLEIHIAKHLQKLEFKCPHCDKSFGRKNTLTLHIKRHKNDKPFRCFDTIVDGCDAAFITRPLLNNHIKSKHSVQQIKTKNSSQQKRRLGTQRKSCIKKIVTQEPASENTAMLEINSSGTMLTADSSFADAAGLSHAVDENYMLLVVNDEQLLALDTADISAN
ncbi:PREDICTED: zinc finger protein 431 isoform X2 [Bactrocera latifrons]|uniref:zinc finger protein 431 isoform X2 n=1 Tax=Bactrocera latifrons TaxID=174628 RepID=UPI0008DE14E2|nr:PREDICTED: zinc finger protein 431 isoform X2 [Bactrocera latifrons]